MQAVENEWAAALMSVNLEGAELIATSGHDPFRRVYRLGDVVYKIVITDKEVSGSKRAKTLEQEYEILQSCSGIGGIQRAVDFKTIDNISVLLNNYVDGKTLEERKSGVLLFAYIILQLIIVIVRLAFRGVSQNDLLESNILVGSYYRITLIDFDQATQVSPITAILRALFGIGQEGGQGAVYGSLLMLVKNYVITNFPRWLQKIIRIPFRMVRMIYRYYRNRKENMLPVISKDADANVHKLLLAWKIAQKSNASSPGKTRAYYFLDYEDYKFPGERSWKERWHVLSNITDFGGKTILELGCNMGLLSCYLIREAGASQTLGIDMDLGILESARMVAQVFDVNVEFRQTDFDSDVVWERKLVEYCPDIVFALNVLNWVRDKERFLKFLGEFREVIFEGHDSFEIESARLRGVGFRKIRRITITERYRDVLHCLK